MANVIAFLLSVALGVSTPGWTGAAGDAELANTKWKLAAFVVDNEETPVLDGGDVTLEFRADGRAGGNSGCNSYGGEYKVHGQEISFGPIMSTKRACIEDGRMRQEQRFFAALQSVRSFELSGDTLKISYDEGRGTLIFARVQG